MSIWIIKMAGRPISSHSKWLLGCCGLLCTIVFITYSYSLDREANYSFLNGITSLYRNKTRNNYNLMSSFRPKPSPPRSPCSYLLSVGTYNANQWQPEKCRMYFYTKQRLNACMRQRRTLFGHTHVVFAGDSRVQETFYAMASMLRDQERKKHHSNSRLDVNALGLVVEDFYIPYPAQIFKHCTTWLSQMPGRGRPDVVVAGIAAWMIRFWKKDRPRSEALDHYKRYTQDHLFPCLKKLASNGTRVIWKLQDPVVDNRMGPDPNRQLLKNENFDAWNNATIEIMKDSNVELWYTGRLSAYKWLDDLKDGVHYRGRSSAQDQAVQIFYNNFCNIYMEDLQPDHCCWFERLELIDTH